MTSPPITIGVVGAGAMGRGIVQLFAQAGHVVRCHDAQPGAADKAAAAVREMLDKLAEKGRIDAAALPRLLWRIVSAKQKRGWKPCAMRRNAKLHPFVYGRKAVCAALARSTIPLPTSV